MSSQTQRVADELFELAAERIRSVEEVNSLKILPPEVGDTELLVSICTAEDGATITTLDVLAFSVADSLNEDSWRAGQMHRLSLIGCINPLAGMGYNFIIVSGWINTPSELEYFSNRCTRKTRGVARIVTVLHDVGEEKYSAIVDVGLPDAYVFSGRTESEALKLAEAVIQDSGYVIVQFPWEIEKQTLEELK